MYIYVRILGYLFIFVCFSTKLECAGQCMITASCKAFNYYGTSCELINPAYTYHNAAGSTATAIYIEDNISGTVVGANTTR